MLTSDFILRFFKKKTISKGFRDYLTFLSTKYILDKTDVMYETMSIYPLSWIYYLTFIFLTAFIFLNMMVGTILEIMSKEHESYRAESHGESGEGGEPASRAQIDKLSEEIAELKALIQKNNDKINLS